MPKQYTGRRVKPNHANAKPRYIIAIDCESVRTPLGNRAGEYQHTFRLGTAKSCRIANDRAGQEKSKRFTSAADLRQFIYDSSGDRYTTWVVAHGLMADFRLAEFARDIDNEAIVLDRPRAVRKREHNDIDDSHCSGLLVLESPPTIIAVRCAATGGRIVFVDTLNWFCCPLRDLGFSLGLPKLVMPHWDATENEWFEYCERDTEICYRTFLELVFFASKHQLGNFAYTAASQAMRAFRHGRNKHDICVHDNMMVKGWEREAYFGGRSEVFRIGEIPETCHQLDVNSLFPSIMATCQVPVRLNEYYENCGSSTTISEQTAARSVCECTIYTDRPIYPVRREGFVCYPTGQFRTTLCGAELSAAVRIGHVGCIHSISVYDTANVFDLFVSDFWKLRQEYRLAGNKLWDTFVKSILNSLYGKFAQRAPLWQPCEDIAEIPEWGRMNLVNMQTGEIKEYRKFGKYCQENIGKQEKLDSFVAISAFITSAARVRMNGLREIAGKSNVFYQGVDGLIVNDRGMGQLEAAGEVDYETLGKMRLEYSGNPTTIYGVSDYKLGEKVVLAGRPTHAQQIDDSTWLATILQSSSGIFNGSSPIGMRESQIKWSRSDNYRKGIIQPDGWVQPHVANYNYGSGIKTSVSSKSTALANCETSCEYVSGSVPSHVSEALSNTRNASSSVNPNSDLMRSLF